MKALPKNVLINDGADEILFAAGRAMRASPRAGSRKA